MDGLNKIYNKIYTKLGAMWPLLVAVALGVAAYAFWQLGGVDSSNVLAHSVPFICILAAAIYVVSRTRKMTDKSFSLAGFILACIISVYSSYRLISMAMLKTLLPKTSMLIIFAGLMVAIFALVAGVIRLLTGIVIDKEFDKKTFGMGLIGSFVIFFIIYVYVPAESFFGNFSDYAFPYQILIRAYIANVLFWSSVISIILAMLKKQLFPVFYGMLLGFLLGVYAQYMFFNRSIGSVDGTRYNWQAHATVSIVNIVVWILLIVLGLVLGARLGQKSIRPIKYGFIFIGLIHLMTYVTLIIQADKMCFNYSAIYYSYENQYKVATDNNIIVFIVDALDNDYAMELYEGEDSVLDYYHDFSMYTNTCSVYDYTSASMLQMMTNYEFDNTLNNLERREVAWNTQWANEFYDRLHSAGYRVEVYNFDNEDTDNVLGKIDNAVAIESADNRPQYISYKGIRQNIDKLTRFTLFPNIAKGMVSIDNIDFKDSILFRGQNVIYNNDDFYNNLSLELGDYDKAVIVQHTIGCHAPYDNVDTARYCLMYVGEYIEQMKELGVYDNATIIVTADHGAHDDDPELGRFASTPLLLIKRAGESRLQIELNGAPVYHEDFMPSILEAAGLYSSDDESLFGKTFFDYHEGDQRERTWYDRVLDDSYTMQIKYNTYYGYTYVGDEQDLKDSVLTDTNLTIYPVPRNND